MLTWQVRGMRIARAKGYGATFDGVNDLQVARHAALSDTEALATLERVIPKALRYRRRLPMLVRATPVPVPGTVDFLRRTAGRAPADGLLATGFVMW
jgi:hypothetical protein